MENSYHVVGGDGQAYGPTSLEQLKSWVQEGRIAAETLVARSDSNTWQPAASYPELGIPPAEARPAQAVPEAAAAATARAVVSRPAPHAPKAPARSVPSAAAEPLIAVARSGGGWFYWIAGLSLVNTIGSLAGSSWGFIIGLGITQVFDAFASEAGGGAKTVALVLDIMAFGLFVLFGHFAKQMRGWAFLIGMILYALDGLLFLLFRQWMAVAFHGLALFYIFRGYQACREYNAIARQPD